MDSKAASDLLNYTEISLCAVALGTILARGLYRKYNYLVLFLLARILIFSVSLPLFWLSTHGAMEMHAAYKTYFYSYWLNFALESVLTFFVIWNVFRLAMDPLPGLQNLGRVMFRWAGGLSLALAISTAFGPHVNGTKYVIRFIQGLQQTQSVLALGMLFFVCVTIKPMGLSWRSKIFGVNLGLGLLSLVQLVSAAWLAQNESMYSKMTMFSGATACVTFGLWTLYMASPEPKRRMIVLPTTSPFFHWNRISQILGDEPGFVALGEVTEDMLDPTEVHMMRRAAARMSNAYPSS